MYLAGSFSGPMGYSMLFGTDIGHMTLYLSVINQYHQVFGAGSSLEKIIDQNSVRNNAGEIYDYSYGNDPRLDKLVKIQLHFGYMF